MSTTKYIEYNSSNPIWKHYLRELKGDTAICKIPECKRIIKISGGSTKGLHTHLSTMHNKQVKSSNITTSFTSASTSMETTTISHTSKITHFLTKDDQLPKILARMSASDGISFNVIKIH